MSHSQDRHSFKRALGVSTALHLLLAPLLLTSTLLALGNARASSPPGATETTRVSYLTIERRTKATRHVQAAARPRPVRKIALTPDRPKASSPASATRAWRAAPEVLPARPLAVGRVALTPEAAAPEHPSLLAPRIATPVPTATPTPAATPPQTAEATAAPAVDAPPGAWGQTFDKPLVADEAALTELRSRYHAGSAVTIEVDDAGHAIRIALPSGLPDEVRVELERRLRELRYVPAECNGLKCGGTLEISI